MTATNEEEKILNQKFEEFKANFESFGSSFPNVNDFQKKMMIKGQIVSQTSDFLSAIIYYSMALWSYALTGSKDRASISVLQNLIISNRQKLRAALQDTNAEETPLFIPEKQEDMVNKVTGERLNFQTLAGAVAEKEMIRSKFIYPLLYDFLYLTEDNNVLLYGPPGTGKTLLAKAAVGELNKNSDKIRFLFFNLSADTVRSKWEGGTEKNIAALFRTAGEQAAEEQKKLRGTVNPLIVVKSILFLDEVEALTKARDQGGDDRSVTTLLQQMDGFKTAGNVMVIAATNFPWTLDSAFLRRFNARVFVDLPDFPARLELIFETIISKFLKKSENKQRLRTLKVLPGITGDKTMTKFSTAFARFSFSFNGESPTDAMILNFINSKYEESGNFLDFPKLDGDGFFKKYACYVAKRIASLTEMDDATKKTWVSQEKENLLGFTKFLFFVAELTGPNSDMVIEGKQLITDRRTSVLGLSKYGHSPSDIVKVIAEFFAVTAQQIITSCYEKTTNANCNSTENCFRRLIDDKVLYPCTRDDMRFNVIQQPPSKDRQFLRQIEGNFYDSYTIFIPDLMRIALLSYITTTGNADYYCNLIEYKRTNNVQPNLGEKCRTVFLKEQDSIL